MCLQKGLFSLEFQTIGKGYQIHIIKKRCNTSTHTGTQELPRLELSKTSLYRIESQLSMKGVCVYLVWYNILAAEHKHVPKEPMSNFAFFD